MFVAGIKEPPGKYASQLTRIEVSLNTIRFEVGCHDSPALSSLPARLGSAIGFMTLIKNRMVQSMKAAFRACIIAQMATLCLAQSLFCQMRW
jgi:hypothetical protein